MTYHFLCCACVTGHGEIERFGSSSVISTFADHTTRIQRHLANPFFLSRLKGSEKMKP